MKPTPTPADGLPLADSAPAAAPPSASAPAPTQTVVPRVEPAATALARPRSGIDMQALLATALEKGQDGVAMLERLHALNREMRADEAREAFGEALREFQSECPAIRKNKTADIASRGGRGYAYNYADFDQITSTVRPLLHKHGLAFSFDSETSPDGKTHTTICTLRHTAGHSEKSRFTCPISNPNPGMSDQQKSGGAYTFARRYALIGALGIATTEDDIDGQDAQDVEPITEKEAHDITVRLESVGADIFAFCQYFGVMKVGSLPTGRLAEALSLIEAKEKKARVR